MALGIVKTFSSEKGYGFIQQDDDGADVWFHFSAIQADGYKKLPQGAKVEYEVALGAKGPQAEQVRKLG
ncbi:cold-shock protein [Streptomyces sp. ZAF1911]|uniref:cold-shock protein n=1 Tax=Streptomyces sp. ZAF1911 TaxID=2944129 RepID=UPI00237C2CEE|nr:cold-shock protein [Streptomyces sp. ZAF1911]MDD9375140.1 cold-shock protein [Streptomyces sp. ZAF1911]